MTLRYDAFHHRNKWSTPMARKSRADKAEASARIVDSAAASIRSRGLCATTIPRVMSEAGLTVGAFFRHFPSREALVSTAFAHAVEALLAPVENGQIPADTFLDAYLSQAHVEGAFAGCPVAALGLHSAEAASGSAAAIGDAVSRLEAVVASTVEARLTPSTDGVDPDARAAVALMLGAVLIARASPMAPAQQARFLDACRQALPIVAAGAYRRVSSGEA